MSAVGVSYMYADFGDRFARCVIRCSRGLKILSLFCEHQFRVDSTVRVLTMQWVTLSIIYDREPRTFDLSRLCILGLRIATYHGWWNASPAGEYTRSVRVV